MQFFAFIPRIGHSKKTSVFPTRILTEKFNAFCFCYKKLKNMKNWSQLSARSLLWGSHIEIRANYMKKWDKEHQTFFIDKYSIFMPFVLLFHMMCKISNFNMWTENYLAQASCTELTLKKTTFIGLYFPFRILFR